MFAINQERDFFLSIENSLTCQCVLVSDPIGALFLDKISWKYRMKIVRENARSISSIILSISITVTNTRSLKKKSLKSQLICFTYQHEREEKKIFFY